MKIVKTQKIHGLYSIADSEALEKALNKVKGVKAYVDIISSQAQITYKDKAVDWEQILRKIEAMGFHIKEDGPDRADAQNGLSDFPENMSSYSDTEPGLDSLLFNPNASALDLDMVDLIGLKSVSGRQILYYAASATSLTLSPLQALLAKLAEENGIRADLPQSIDTSVKKGIRARLDQQDCCVGTFEYMVRQTVDITKMKETPPDCQPVYVAVEDKLVGAILLKNNSTS